MVVIDEALLSEFRSKVHCEWCGQGFMRHLHPHHLWCRGMGGGSRLDIRENLIALCPTVGTREGCHDRAHRGDVTRSDLLAVVARREGKLQGEIEAEVYRLLRQPRGSPRENPRENR